MMIEMGKIEIYLIVLSMLLLIQYSLATSKYRDSFWWDRLLIGMISLPYIGGGLAVIILAIKSSISKHIGIEAYKILDFGDTRS